MRPSTFGALKTRIVLGCFALALAGCESEAPAIRTGEWRVELDLNGEPLPFSWLIKQDSSGGYHAVVQNGEESLDVRELRIERDSFFLRMPLFDSEFLGRTGGDSLISGFWRNYTRGEAYQIPFTAVHGPRPRFAAQDSGAAERFAGIWQTWFSPNSPEAYNAVGRFDADPDGSITGTFMTETGDYRFLAGSASADSMHLSCFDGSHAFLFAASLRNDSLFGRFWSGTHWQEPWIAVRNGSYRLRNPDSLTFLQEGFDRVAFRFPDLDGVERSPDDPEFSNHPLLIHIMGSWCPNCMDETVLLREMHEKYGPRGLRIMAVAFEKQSDPKRALDVLRRYAKSLNVPYPILYGGSASKEEAGEKLPFLKRLISYPTCLFIARDGTILRIRTGFYGPGTGSHYDSYRKDLDDFLQRMVEEA